MDDLSKQSEIQRDKGSDMEVIGFWNVSKRENVKNQIMKLSALHQLDVNVRSRCSDQIPYSGPKTRSTPGIDIKCDGKCSLFRILVPVGSRSNASIGGLMQSE